MLLYSGSRSECGSGPAMKLAVDHGSFFFLGISRRFILQNIL